MLTVRSYTPHDAAATIEIVLRAIRDVASKDSNPAQIDAWAQVESHEGWARRRASRPTWTASVDGVPAGFSDLEPNGYLDMMRRGFEVVALQVVQKRGQVLKNFRMEKRLA